MFPATIDIQQVDEIFPTLIECLEIRRNLFGVRELAVVRIDLILHPPQIFDGFTLSRIETSDNRLALGLAQLARTLFFATRHQPSINGTDRDNRQIDNLSTHGQQERRNVLKKHRCNSKADHPPKIDRLFERLFYVSEIEFG